MGKRRGNNEGSIYQRQDGRWCARISLEGRRLAKYFKTQRECREWLEETRPQVKDGLTMDSAKKTVADFFAQWLETVKQSVRPNTARQYERIARQHILPRLGPLHLKDLRPDHIQALYNALRAAGTGARTVRLTHSVLHRALNQALKFGLLRRNPADAVDKPKAPHTEMHTLSPEQARSLLQAAQGHRLEALLHLAVNTGLRQGELLGLRWSDLDWKTGALQVQRQMQRVTGQGKGFVEPKTAAGRRSVILGPGTVAKLREHGKRQKEERLFMGAQWQEQGLMFTSTIGTAMEPHKLVNEFKALLTAAGLPDIRFHDLRHTAATLMLQQGVHPKIVQQRLGHSQIAVTLDTYSHVLPSMQAEAAARVEALLDQSGKNELEHDWNKKSDRSG